MEVSGTGTGDDRTMEEDLQEDLFLQELKDLAESSQMEQSEEPPRKKARTEEEVITRQPVLVSDSSLGGSYGTSIHPSRTGAPAFIGYISQRHTLAPEIPVASEVPMPSGYRPDRPTTDGISAGRPLVDRSKLKKDHTGFSLAAERERSTHESIIRRLAQDNPAPFVAPTKYILKKAGVEWEDPTLAQWNPSMYQAGATPLLTGSHR